MGAIGAVGKLRKELASRGQALGIEELDQASFEALRIEAGTPVFGRDLAETNLPQELDRDERTINFVKGCYLGQETVARIDAVGHVNQLLRGLQLPPGSSPPPPGAWLEHAGQRVGFVTSAAFSPGWNAAIALGLIRRSHATAGTVLIVRSPHDASGHEPATVCELPMLPPLR
jgi:folate-binding protein YgfZ